MSLLSTRALIALALPLSFAVTGCAITFPDYPLGSGGASSGSMSSGSQMIEACVPSQCDPEKLSDSAVDPSCGVFVAPASMGGTGTQGSPYGDLTTALMNANQRPIYVCATNGPLNEAVSISGAAAIYGGFDCTTWKKSSAKTEWKAAPNGIPLRIANTAFKSCDGAFVDGFAIKPADAMGADTKTRNGNSSIGVFASGGVATLVNVDILAGNGADGASAVAVVTPADGAQSAPTTFNGHAGNACGTGGPKVPHTCDSQVSCADPTSMTVNTDGARGGDGGLMTGGTGGHGLPDDPNGGILSFTGNGGSGENPQSNPPTCQPGEPGWSMDPGSVGQPRNGPAGAGGTTLGTLDANGYQGAAGADGCPGDPGQGGGGGGGVVGNGAHGCAVNAPGSGGGGGGAGGCGGKGGPGGGAGGASIALVSFGANVLFMNVTLTARQGGKGADGVAGQPGGTGGAGGPGGCTATTDCACAGGSGADGGSGGAGGGGKGGGSYGIAFHGDMAPAIPDASIAISLTHAAGGKDASGSNVGLGSGAPGDAVKIQQFP